MPWPFETLVVLDRLKSVERRNYLADGSRRENAAEHSWHLAMAAWWLAEHLALPVQLDRLLKMALIHDLPELSCGDTFLYDPRREQAAIAEAEAMAALGQLPGAPEELLALWQEQEAAQSPEARVLKALDRLLPLLLNLRNGGLAWREHGIRRSQVEAAHQGLFTEFPALKPWVDQQLNQAQAEGFLLDG